MVFQNSGTDRTKLEAGLISLLKAIGADVEDLEEFVYNV